MIFDIEQPGALIRYLRSSGRIQPGESPDVQVLAGGVSNRTVAVHRSGGEHWVIKQALPKLRVAVDWFSPPERILRESLGLRWLARLLPEDALPRFVFEDPEHFLLCMSAAPEPHVNWKSMLLDGRIVPAHVDQFAYLMAAIHAEQSAGAASAFGDTSFFESLRLEPYYAYTADRVPAASRFLRTLIDDTRASKRSLVHGDYSPKNILVHAGGLMLLDHEVIHFGDPAFDVGFSLTHLLSKAHHLAPHREDFAAAAERYWRKYVSALSAAESWEERAVRHTLGCLLARVDGRSPLEYLSGGERDRQRAAVLTLMDAPPRFVPALIAAFIGELA